MFSSKIMAIKKEKGYGFLSHGATDYFFHVHGRREARQVPGGVCYVPTDKGFSGLREEDCVIILTEKKPDRFHGDRLTAMEWIPSSEMVILLYAVIRSTTKEVTGVPVCDLSKKLFVAEKIVTNTERVVFVGIKKEAESFKQSNDRIVRVS